jgi:hypothetical protein
MMNPTRNYQGLSMEQLQQFKLLFEAFSQKDRTVMREGVGSITFTFGSQADMLIWDALMKKEGLA